MALCCINLALRCGEVGPHNYSPISELKMRSPFIRALNYTLAQCTRWFISLVVAAAVEEFSFILIVLLFLYSCILYYQFFLLAYLLLIRIHFYPVLYTWLAVPFKCKRLIGHFNASRVVHLFYSNIYIYTFLK